MTGFPDIRLYKSNYTSADAIEISKEKGSIVFSSKTKRIYVGKQQYGGDIQDIKWNPDAAHKKYTLNIENVNPSKSISILWDNNTDSVYVTQNNVKVKVASFENNIEKIKLKKDILAKNLHTKEDEVLVPKNTNLQNTIQILARQFENNFVWHEYLDEDE